MHKFLRIFRFLLAIEAMRRVWRKFHPIRILKLISVVFLGAAAVAIVIVLLKKLSEKDEQPEPEPVPAPEPELKAAPESEPEPVPAPEPELNAAPESEPEQATNDETAPPTESGECPASHPVKAINRSGIYHSVESRWYERSKADICFKDAATAEAAGFRAPGTTPK